MAQRRSVLTYIRLKIITSIIRLPLALSSLYPGWNRLGFVPRSESVKPTYNTYVPSTTSTRKIKILVHEPKAVSKDSLLPVHINFHGSAFILPCLDCDAELCHHISNTLGCIVIDGDYAKAPEHPFPAGLEDVMDVINWVASQPDRFDVNRITVGGQSAGGALALSASAILPNGVVKGAALFYPGTDFSRSGLPDDQRMYKPYIRGKTPGIGLGRTVRNFYKQCYVLPGADPRNPRMSPLFADPSAFPPVFLTVGDADPLCKEGEALIRKLQDSGVSAELMMIPDAGHGWDRYIKENDPKFGPLRRQAIQGIVDHLRKVQAAARL